MAEEVKGVAPIGLRIGAPQQHELYAASRPMVKKD
jgi:hypothetical protein